MPELTDLSYVDIDPQKLRTVRENKGLSQKWIAGQLEIGKASYSSYECGESRPSYQTVERLCEILDISITDISDVGSIAKTLDAIKRVGKLYGLDIKAA